MLRSILPNMRCGNAKKSCTRVVVVSWCGPGELSVTVFAVRENGASALVVARVPSFPDPCGGAMMVDGGGVTMCVSVAPGRIASCVPPGNPTPWCHLPKGHAGPHQCGDLKWLDPDCSCLGGGECAVHDPRPGVR
jgi:hypothetical protein